MCSVCVASAVRIVMMDQLVKSPDVTWAMSKVFIWSCCEPFIGIVCACLPTYAPLLRRLWRRDTTASNSDSPTTIYVSDKSNTGKRGSRKTGLSTTTRTLRGDDEIELTVDIHSGQDLRQGNSRDSSKRKASPEGQLEFYPNDIMVTKDFSWSSSA
ncbi:hypothetical protein B0H67DRAFT_595253 [Lasiosphaeris hirsuta]|uniref:Rhodopsin domain-containing protein n=1 Tax=Lasiosphaeris hirsuta TaxID=260670 RepID=A0AA39ZRD3_9PEZI|nr:hypothetical protein B0H67DRAFT_595253 [Lasiosphaeris hirsuta]